MIEVDQGGSSHRRAISWGQDRDPTRTMAPDDGFVPDVEHYELPIEEIVGRVSGEKVDDQLPKALDTGSSLKGRKTHRQLPDSLREPRLFPEIA